MSGKPITLEAEVQHLTDDPWGDDRDVVHIRGWRCACGARHEPRKRRRSRAWSIEDDIASHLMEHHGAPRPQRDGCPCGGTVCAMPYTTTVINDHTAWLLREWAA